MFLPVTYPMCPEVAQEVELEHTFLSYAVSTQQYNQIRNRMGKTGQMIHFPCPSTS